MVAGVSLSAVLADLVGWRAVFVVVALLAAIALATIASMRLDTPAAGEAAPSPFEALSIAGIRPLLVACAAFMASFYGVYAYLGDHLHEVLGQPVSANGLAALAYGIGFGAAATLDGVVDRLGARRVMPLAYLAVSAVYLAAAAVVGTFALLVAVVGLWGLANHFGLNVLVMRLSALDPSRRGTIMGLNSAVTYLAMFLGTTAFGPIYANFGFAPCALAGAALMLVAAFAATR
jgi:DHA1 family inner membrane transport protein